MFNLDDHLAASKRTIADMEHHADDMRHAVQYVCWKVGALIRRHCPVTQSSATGKNIWP